MINYAQEAHQRFGQKYKRLCIPDELLRVNAAPIGITFGTCESEYQNDVATALWILDQLVACGNVEKAFQYFPDKRLAYDNVKIPRLTDSCHSEEVLVCMVYIIRKIDLPDDGTEMTPLQRFREIIKLIDPHAIRTAITRFEEKMWSFFDDLLFCIDFHKECQQQYADELLSLIESNSSIKKELVEICCSFKDSQSSPVPLAGPMRFDFPLHNPEMDLYLSYRSKFERLGDAEKKMAEKINETLDKIDHEEFRMDLVCLLGPYLQAKIESFERIIIREESKQRLLALTIDDPYEMCFAHFFMLVEETGAVWLYTLSVTVLYAAVALLPWNGTLDKNLGWETQLCAVTDDVMYDEEDIMEIAPEEAPLTINHTEEYAELYQRKFKDKGLWADPSLVSKSDVDYVNFPQIVYALTGTVMPRRPFDNADIADRLQNCGVRSSQRKVLSQYILLASAHRERTRLPEGHHTMKTGMSSESELKQRIDRYRMENEKLDRLLKESFNEKNAERKRAEVAEEQLEKSIAEIAELRAMIYDRAIFQNEKRSTISFPYAVRHKVTIFGGHEVWLNMIKPLLSGVRYVGPDERPNMSVLMNTDVMWLQTNVMAHSFYNKVVEVARTHNIPVRYFSYSGAEKCAEQLALDDMKNK